MINKAIDNKAEDALVEALRNPRAELPKIHSTAAALYLQEFGCIKAEKQAVLEYDEIVGGLEGKRHWLFSICTVFTTQPQRVESVCQRRVR